MHVWRVFGFGLLLFFAFFKFSSSGHLQMCLLVLIFFIFECTVISSWS